MLMSKLTSEESEEFQKTMASLPDIKAREDRASHMVDKLARETKQKK